MDWAIGWRKAVGVWWCSVQGLAEDAAADVHIALKLSLLKEVGQYLV